MCLNVFTCFRSDDGSVYRLLHEGNLQKYGFSVECVRVCLKRSEEFEYALLHPSTWHTYGYSFQTTHNNKSNQEINLGTSKWCAENERIRNHSLPFHRSATADGFSDFRHVKNSSCIRYNGGVSVRSKDVTMKFSIPWNGFCIRITTSLVCVRTWTSILYRALNPRSDRVHFSQRQ